MWMNVIECECLVEFRCECENKVNREKIKDAERQEFNHNDIINSLAGSQVGIPDVAGKTNGPLKQIEKADDESLRRIYILPSR